MNVLMLCASALVAIGLASIEAAPCTVDKTLDDNKDLCANALDAFFNKLDMSAVDKYIGASYSQHNPSVKDGPEQLKAVIGMLPAGTKFELGTLVAKGDLVWTHGRYSGIPGFDVMIIVDIFRVKDGRIIEH